MGKGEDEHGLSVLPLPPDLSEENAGHHCSQCCRIAGIFRPRCVFALVFGLAVLLSAVYWLPPFLRHGAGARNQHRSSMYGADIVASFRLERPVSLLNANIMQLRYDIFEEIGVPDTLVAIISLDPLDGLNSTDIVFSIWPYPKNSAISSTGLSLLRASFMSLVVQQSTLHLTTSLFGYSSSFQVLKFPGGITIIPSQRAFLLQEVHILFNFTLNFPICEVQDKLDELKEQMKSGLLLNSYENLYVKLTNINGSTISPPTVVQTAVVLAVGNHQPSVPRLKQLAQTIKNSSEGNLGLNHTVFGRVKQIQLSSYFQHSLNSSGKSTSLPPSPTPQPHIQHHRHHHHHHHPRSGMHLAPAPAPAPQHSYPAAAPSCCQSGISSKPNSMVPSMAPAASPQHSSAPPSNKDPPAPSPHFLSAPPLPAVVLAHARPPSETEPDPKPPEGMLPISPLPFSSSVGGLHSVHLALVSLLCFLMHL